MYVFVESSGAAASAVSRAMEWMHLSLDASSVVVIAIGGIAAVVALPGAVGGKRRFTQVRLDFARYLALALEFQLASDVLQTAIAPSWNQLGTLAAIAAIRTLLNFFLAREMEDERAVVGNDGMVTAKPRVSAVPGSTRQIAEGMKE
jgi:uncharacterized membrane protein